MGDTDETKLEDDLPQSSEQQNREGCVTKEAMAEHGNEKLEEELQMLKMQLSEAEEERDQAETELPKARTEAYEEKSRFSNEKAEPQNKRIQELEEELERQKESEAKKLEELKVSLEESRATARSLRHKYEELLNGDHGEEKDESDDIDVEEMLTDELQLTKESLFRAQEGERAALSKAQSLLSEIGKLRNELKLATNAEINSTKAMDDLAIALSEVAAESNKVKLRLELAESEVANSRREVEELKLFLEESRRESGQFKKKAERSTREAEETLMTWTEKENGFVQCIRRAEEEKDLVHAENIRLLESERASKEENTKLRDILKQALNETNVAKEAANIAKAENFQLKDSLADKEEALEFLTMEIESLRRANVVEEKEVTLKNALKKESPKILAKAFSFNIKELKINTKHKESDSGEEREGDEEDPDDSDPLKGSIFDVMDSPGSARHRRKGSSCFSGEGTPLTQEELAQLEDSHLHDLENGRFSSRRRRLLRKFGDLIIRRRPSYAEPSK